jgi:glutamine synthetase
MLKPVFTCPDPIRGGDNVLVLCEVYNAKDGKPHPTNTRAACEKAAKKYAKHEMIFGIEQEYTFLKLDGTPLGFPNGGFPAPQGPYYCGVGAGRVAAREIIEEHTQACIDAGLMIEGTNAEVMPGQWEFQIGAADASPSATTCTWPAGCSTASPRTTTWSSASPPSRRRATGTAPVRTPTSRTKAMRETSAEAAIKAACEAIGKKRRPARQELRPRHREPPHRRPRDRPVQQVQLRRQQPRRQHPHPVAGRADGKGYAEDRRPNANCDPYTVTRLILETVCALQPACARPASSPTTSTRTGPAHAGPRSPFPRRSHATEAIGDSPVAHFRCPLSP